MKCSQNKFIEFLSGNFDISKSRYNVLWTDNDLYICFIFSSSKFDKMFLILVFNLFETRNFFYFKEFLKICEWNRNPHQSTSQGIVLIPFEMLRTTKDSHPTQYTRTAETTEIKTLIDLIATRKASWMFQHFNKTSISISFNAIITFSIIVPQKSQNSNICIMYN